MSDFSFDLDNPVEDLTSVPKDFQYLFEQTDDGYVVAQDHRAIAGTINALGANLANSRKTKKQASDESATRRRELNALTEVIRTAGFEGEDLTPEAVTEFITGLSTKAAEGQTAEDVAEKLRNQRAEMEKSKASELEKERANTARYRTAIDDLLIDSQATAAIAAEKGVPALLLPVLKAETKVVEEEGKFSSAVVDPTSGEIRFNGKGDPMTIRERVAELKGDPIYGRAFESELPGGGGKQPDTTTTRKPVSPGARAAEDKSSASKISSGLAKLGRR